MRSLLDLTIWHLQYCDWRFPGRGLVGGSSNTVIGGLAGDAMTDNVSNVVIGKSAFSASNGGENHNVVIGSDVGASIDNGDGCTKCYYRTRQRYWWNWYIQIQCCDRCKRLNSNW